MALPTILYALLENGNQIKIENAVVETRKPLVIYDTEMYRDKPSLVVGGAGLVGATADPFEMTIAGGATQTVTKHPTEGDGVGGYVDIVAPSSVVQEDDYTHIPKRYIPKMDTICEFWDAATVGLAMTMSVTTASGSAVITVPDATLLTPGQGISGTGIPAGTTILSILSQSAGVITYTTATMSQQATATGTVAATLTGSNKVGEFKYSEFLGYGSEISTPM